VAVLPPDHPLVGAPVFPVAELEGMPFIKLREKVDFEISHFLDRISYKPKFCYEVSSDHTILSMVECGAGVSILHSVMAGSGRYRVLWKPLDINQYRDIAIATNKNTRLSGAARLFVQHVCREIPARCDSLLFPGEPTA